MCVASVLAFPEYHIQRILRGGGGGGGSSGGRSSKKQECPKKNVTFTNSDGSTGWKIKKVCSDDGWIIGVCIGAVVVAFMLCMLLCQYLNDLERKRNVLKCEKEEHSLRRTDGVEFYNRGYVEYKYTWLCDKCNKRQGSTTSNALFRCNQCRLDYCPSCGERPINTRDRGEFGESNGIQLRYGGNNRSVVPVNEVNEE